MAIEQLGIRLGHDRVNIGAVHPEQRERIRRMFAEARRTIGELEVYSGARTHAHQTQLYQSFLDRGRRHPVVANPNYRHPSTGRFGSAHQVQKAETYQHGNLPNWFDAAYACDIRWASRKPPSAAQQRSLEQLAARHGLRKSVSTEWWHFVPFRDRELLTRFGYGARGNPVVELQKRLNLLGGDVVGDAKLVVDGMYFAKTAEAMMRFQRMRGRLASGDYLEADHEEILKLTSDRVREAAEAREAAQEAAEERREAKGRRRARRARRAARAAGGAAQEEVVTVDADEWDAIADAIDHAADLLDAIDPE